MGGMELLLRRQGSLAQPLLMLAAFHFEMQPYCTSLTCPCAPSPPAFRACNEFVDAVGPNRPFMGGAQPNLADLAVFGVLQAVRNTPTFNDAMANSRIGAWFGRVEAAIGAGSRVSTGGSAWSLAPKAK